MWTGPGLRIRVRLQGVKDKVDWTGLDWTGLLSKLKMKFKKFQISKFQRFT